MKWISVKRRLPRDEDIVIAFGDDEHEEGIIRTCEYGSKDADNEETWIISFPGSCCNGFMENVTHWMPLPRKPLSSFIWRIFNK